MALLGLIPYCFYLAIWKKTILSYNTINLIAMRNRMVSLWVTFIKNWKLLSEFIKTYGIYDGIFHYSGTSNESKGEFMFLSSVLECIIVLLVHLLACEVTGRIPVIPLARHRVVMTRQGSVRGYYAPRPPHYAFLGLPYARPPTGYDRFKAPEPPAPWSGIFEATHRVKCPQPDGSGEENCLVVNVFIPESAEAAPVIVHLHDGGFQSGWGTFSAPQRLLEQGFVFISFNYRIGALGFLCIEEVLGNAGIKDQVAALYWIYKNIDRFGGNPTDVTVYGTGSGAVSIEILLMSNLTKNLFQKAILESGSVLSPSAITRYPGLRAHDLAKFLGYRGDFSPQSLIEYYFKVPVNILVNISTIFGPCIEKELPFSQNMLVRDPREILESGEYQHIPMMIVYTNAEEVDIISNNQEKFYAVADNVEDLLPNNLIFDNKDVKDKIVKMIKKFYFDDIDAHGVIQSLIDYSNDIFMEYPIAKSATYHAHMNKNPVYFMKFRYNINTKSKNQEIATAGYKKIFLYITSTSLMHPDELIAQRLTRLWTNFVNLGDPTPLTTPLLNVIWQPIESYEVGGKIVLHNVPRLDFGLSMGNTLLSGQHLKFWESIYEKFYINMFEQ